jgi:ribosomal protein S18 acetylase RimI-like enzyme
MRISLVSPAQQESLIDLLCEINVFYHPTDPADRETVRDHVVHNLLSPASPHRLVVASRPNGSVAGLAAITLAFSLVEPEMNRRKHCQLKELYVSAADRNKGIGHALMVWVADYSIQHDCYRIDWPVKAANHRGIAFYESLGAQLVEDRLSYRLGELSVRQLAGQTLGGAA